MKRLENPKFKQIVITARNLFWKYGTRRVTIEEICSTAEVSKATFYKHFRNKVALVKFILDQLNYESMKRYHEIMDSDRPFTEKVRLTVELKFEQTRELSQEFFKDVHKNADTEILAHFNRMVQEGLRLVYRDYLAAQQRGDIRGDIRPEFIIYMLNHIVEMAEDERLARMYRSPQDLIMELTRFFFYGIMPTEDPDRNSESD